MKIDLKPSKPLPEDFMNEISNDLNGIWLDAANAFFAKYVALTAHNEKPPAGIQAFINERLQAALVGRGWEGEDGRFIKDGVWLRITFRNQMSIGSDFMDGLLLAHRENIRALVIAAPSLEFAKLITPRDANTIVSFEKLEEYFARAQDLFQVPLAIGKLSPTFDLAPEVTKLITSRL